MSEVPPAKRITIPIENSIFNLLCISLFSDSKDVYISGLIFSKY